jgi:adenylate cyclase
MILPKGVRVMVLAALTAGAVLTVLNYFRDWPPLRSMETASLDLRFRVRGVEPPGNETTVVLIDDHTVDELGGWPLSHGLFAKALDTLRKAKAKVVVFDLLFAQPERSLSPALRAAIGAAASALSPTADDKLKETLQALSEDDPDAAFARAIQATPNVYLPIAFFSPASRSRRPPLSPIPASSASPKRSCAPPLNSHRLPP